MERALLPFTFPLAGIRMGITTYNLRVEDDFFQCFPDAPVQAGSIDLELDLDKRPDMIVATFRFEGRVATTCDRCLADIGLPIDGEQDLIIKYGETFKEEDEVIWLSQDMREFNLARFAYEFIVLGIPVVRTYDCEDDDPRPCDMEMLATLDKHRKGPDSEEEEEEETDNPFRNILDELNKN
ncbi:MAG: DUF177 domain-containing protein [Saprospiraceae bacterium]|nr:DUF177 domain-containing protein [Saprospiraceae bacterium]